MPPKRNEFSEVVLALKDELARARKEAGKARPVRFGEERLSARDARNRYGQMSRGEIERLTSEQRKDMLDLLGTNAVLNQLRA